MAITPPSDIVLGVSLAVDPEKYRLAAERLRQLGGTQAARTDTAPSSTPTEATTRPPVAGPAPGSAPSVRQGKTAADAFGKLEAFVLQTFIQAMMPKNASHVFGKGTAGEMWKSMLAEKLANEMARSGQVGLARHLSAGRVDKAAAAVGAESARLPAAPVATSATLMRALAGLDGQSLEANPVAATLAMQPAKPAKRS